MYFVLKTKCKKKKKSSLIPVHHAQADLYSINKSTALKTRRPTHPVQTPGAGGRTGAPGSWPAGATAPSAFETMKIVQ